MTLENEKYKLSQQKNIELLTKKTKASDMLTVHLSKVGDTFNYGLFPALVPLANKDEVLSSIDWKFSYENGLPGSAIYYVDEEEVPTYERFGNDDGIEPLILNRNFEGIRDSYIEISEEFRHFHNLYFDSKSNQHLKFDDDGTEHRVILIEDNKVQIRLKEIKQFLAIKEMYLMLQFDFREESANTLDELGIEDGHHVEVDNELMTYGLAYGEMHMFGVGTLSRLLGKVLIEPWPKSKSGMYGFSEPTKKECLDFIIDIDDDGEDILFNSEPDGLANYFGANPDAPNYLTPVYFRKQVLDRYYSQPSKYSVEDSYIRCGSLWGVQIDNHHSDKVCVWLGDLGRDLPFKDQLHWRSYNIPPTGKMSSTYFKRQILAQFTDSDRPEHIFRNQYEQLSKMSIDRLGWQFLLPLSDNDIHHFENVRIPSTNEQKEFDELVLSLTKLLIDSLNEKRLNSLIESDKLASLKGSVNKFDEALVPFGIQGHQESVQFLRKLQALRSASSAHRKGSKYKKISKELGLDDSDLQTVFTDLLVNSVNYLSYLIEVVNSGRVKS